MRPVAAAVLTLSTPDAAEPAVVLFHRAAAAMAAGSGPTERHRRRQLLAPGRRQCRRYGRLGPVRQEHRQQPTWWGIATSRAARSSAPTATEDFSSMKIRHRHERSQASVAGHCSVLTFLFLSAGCGDGAPPVPDWVHVQRITGKVTLANGSPLGQGKIVLTPQQDSSEEPLSGWLDSDGTFTLMESQGLAISHGEFLVHIEPLTFPKEFVKSPHGTSDWRSCRRDSSRSPPNTRSRRPRRSRSPSAPTPRRSRRSCSSRDVPDEFLDHLQGPTHARTPSRVPPKHLGAGRRHRGFSEPRQGRRGEVTAPTRRRRARTTWSASPSSGSAGGAWSMSAGFTDAR